MLGCWPHRPICCAQAKRDPVAVSSSVAQEAPEWKLFSERNQALSRATGTVSERPLCRVIHLHQAVHGPSAPKCPPDQRHQEEGNAAPAPALSHPQGSTVDVGCGDIPEFVPSIQAPRTGILGFGTRLTVALNLPLASVSTVQKMLQVPPVRT